MTKHRAVWLTCLGWLLAGQALAAAPLFDTDVPLEVTIKAPFKAIFRDRDDDAQYQDGTISFSANGGAEKMPLRIKTRGKFRRDRKNCSIPPLRLNFAKDDVGGTVFEGQNKLKLVLPCRDRGDYSNYVELEYLSYRILNQLTEQSFRVRPLRLQMIDTANRDKELNVKAFVIESKRGLAERTGLTAVQVPEVQTSELDRQQAGVVGLFQYLIGNTDWSMLSANEEVCCHNVVTFQRDQQIVPIPYDFDFAGLVNAPYAGPNPKLKIRTVRQRLYRGICIRDNSEELLAQLFAQRAAIDGLVAAANLSKRRAKSTQKFVADFWETLDASDRHERVFHYRCR